MKEGPHFGLVLDLYLIPKKWFYGDLYSKTLINDKLLFEHEVGIPNPIDIMHYILLCN